MPFVSSKSLSEKEYDTSVASSDDLENGRRNYENGRGNENSGLDTLKSSSPSKSKSTFRRRCSCIIFSSILVIGAAVGISLILTNNPNPFDYFIPVDPPGAKEATRWDATEGLFLTIDIATDDVWAPIAEQNILVWNQSEAVVLKANRVPHDPACSPSRGRLKVCNDDYGETPWHGINIILQDQVSNTTIHSISKLNDRYNTNAASRRYIVCHENGHGLGLPHTDEDHFNRDRGDCMDYTVRYENNDVPGVFNLNLLEELYGTPTRPRQEPVAEQQQQSDGSAANDPVSTNSGGNNGDLWDVFAENSSKEKEKENQNEDEEEEEEEDDRRLLRRLEDLDEKDVAEFQRDCSERCKDEYCVYSYKHRYLVKINQFLAPHA